MTNPIHRKTVAISISALLLLIGVSCSPNAAIDVDATVAASVELTVSSRPVATIPETAVPPSPTPASTPTPTIVPPTSMPASSPTPTGTPDPCQGSTGPDASKLFTFGGIVPCLDTPNKVLKFMQSNMTHGGGAWDHEVFGENAYSTAQEVYERGMDDCDGLAEFAACVLHLNGFESYNVGISIIAPLGHNVAGFVGHDGLIYSMNNGKEIEGPFDSWEDLAEYYISKGYAAPNSVLWLFDPCIEDTVIGDSVLGLPHTVLR